MKSAFAAVIFRPDQVTDRALSHGFAVSLAGWEAPDPALLIAPLDELPGWSVAFYRAGTKPAKASAGRLTVEEAFEHAAELFEDELPPGLCVRDAAADRAEAEVYAIVHSDEVCHDDAWRFHQGGFERRFVREGEHGPEAGVETLDSTEITPLDIEDEDDAGYERALRPHRGSTFLAERLGRPVLAALMRALFFADRRLPIRLIEPGAASIAEETSRLNRALGRKDGRGAFELPGDLASAAPAALCAFHRVYDFNDPSDPSDLYRELSIGGVVGTLHFLRAGDYQKLDASRPLGSFPLAEIRGSSLGSGGAALTLALDPDGDTLWILGRDGSKKVAGPTFGELLRYLSLGWSRRDEVEEDLIGALMLRAAVRVSGT